MKSIVLLIMNLLFILPSFAGEILEDFDSLGGNDVLLDRAKALNPEVKTNIVQGRIVDLNKRIEVSPGSSLVLGGDAYTDTWMAGVEARYHFNPQWAVGFKYDHAFNEYSEEGRSLINNPIPIKDGNGSTIGYNPNIPAVDYIKNQTFLTVNWAPIYGKMNFFNKGVVHFDFYALLGYGAVQLDSGSTSSTTAGAGLGLWISKHLSSHIETRWQNYTAQRFPGQKDAMDLTIASLQVGYLL